MALYQAFGMYFESDLVLPEFTPMAILPTDSTCISIQRGNVPHALSDVRAESALYQINTREIRFSLPGIADYLVSDGESIIFQSDMDDATIRLFMYDNALPALFHQRKLLPMQASCIETPKGAALFAGTGGIGKSTLAAIFHQHGYRILSDDITLVQRNAEEKSVALPSFPYLALWGNMLDKLGIKGTDSLHSVRSEIPQYWLPIHAHFSDQPTNVYAFYAIQGRYNLPLTIDLVQPLDRILLLNQRVYHLRLAAGMGLGTEYWLTMKSLMRVPIFKRISTDFFAPDSEQLINTLLEDWS